MGKQTESVSSKLDNEYVSQHVYGDVNSESYQNGTQVMGIDVNNQQAAGKSSKKKTQLKFLQFGMNQKQSLHSHFSSNQIQQFHSLKRNSMSVEQHAQSKNDAISQLNQYQSSSEDGFQTFQDQPFRKFSKHKFSQDLLQTQIIHEIDIINNQGIQEADQKVQSQRNSYTSSQHDGGHLGSPSERNGVKELQSDLVISGKKLQIGLEQAQPKQQEKESQNRLQKANDRDTKISSQPFIKPIAIQINKGTEQGSSSQSPQKSPKRSSKPNKVQVRRIPSQLYESYDQLIISVNKIDKHIKNKNALNSPMKLKQKSNYLQKQRQKNQRKSSTVSSSSMKVNFDEQLFASLSVVQGYCEVRSQNSYPLETKFVIYKNLIVFQAFKRLNIQCVTKVKLIQEREQISIKISHQSSETQKSQVIVITLLSSSTQTYFSQSYEVFSQIILRKLLLMNLAIYELNQKKQPTSPKKSTINSFSSPISVPSSLVKKIAQIPSFSPQSYQTKYQSQLFRKSAFFSSWEKKYFSLSSSKGLRSFACPPSKNEKSKPLTQLLKTSEIWTRFELLYGFLVIKMWQNKLQKIQIGIPLCDFTNTEGQKNWLYGLSKNIAWRQSQPPETKS